MPRTGTWVSRWRKGAITRISSFESTSSTSPSRRFARAGGTSCRWRSTFLCSLRRAAKKGVRGIAPSAAEKLVGYGWPGNVRESRRHRACGDVARYEGITVEDLPERGNDYRPAYLVVGGDDPSELAPLEEVERRYILRVLDAVGGNKSVAARVLGMERKTVPRKLERSRRARRRSG